MNYCAIVAAGFGTRVGDAVPKQFLKVNNKPLIIYTLDTVIRTGLFQHIYIGVQPEHVQIMSDYLSHYYGAIENITLLHGAPERMGTFFNIFNVVKNLNTITCDDYICMMDANRPFVPISIYQECFQKAKEFGVACPARKVINAIGISSDGRFIDHVPLKEILYAFQTPMFCNIRTFEAICTKLTPKQKEKLINITGIYTAMGISPAIVRSNEYCFKITTALDLKLAEVVAKSMCHTIESE